MKKININKIILTVAFATLLFAGKISLCLPCKSMSGLGGIWAAIENDSLYQVKQIVGNRNFDVNQTVDFLGRVTPLLLACYLSENNSQSLEIVRFLLENGAEKSVNVDDGRNNSPISTTCQQSHPNLEIIKLLLEYGAKGENAIQSFMNRIKQGIETNKEFAINRILAKYPEIERNYDRAENKKRFIDEYARIGVIYDKLTNKWLDSEKNQTLFVSKEGFKTIKLLRKYDDKYKKEKQPLIDIINENEEINRNIAEYMDTYLPDEHTLRFLNISKAVLGFYEAKSQMEYVDQYKNTDDLEIYNLLNKMWLYKVKGKNPFLTANGQKIKKEGLKSDVRIWTK